MLDNQTSAKESCTKAKEVESIQANFTTALTLVAALEMGSAKAVWLQAIPPKGPLVEEKGYQ